MCVILLFRLRLSGCGSCVSSCFVRCCVGCCVSIGLNVLFVWCVLIVLLRVVSLVMFGLRLSG